MLHKDYKIWKENSLKAIKAVYNEDEVKYIVDFWDGIRGSTEEEMMGEKAFSGMRAINEVVFGQKDMPFETAEYSQWSMRLWMYAPILATEFRKAKAENR